MLGQHRGGGGLEQLGQVGGGHEGPSYGLGWSAPESVSRRLNALGCRSPSAHSFYCAPVAQGIERLPPEQKAAGSNPAGGTSVLALQRRFLAAIIDLVPSACHSMCRTPVVISA